MMRFKAGDKVVQGLSESPIYEITRVITFTHSDVCMYECFVLPPWTSGPRYFRQGHVSLQVQK